MHACIHAYTCVFVVYIDKCDLPPYHHFHPTAPRKLNNRGDNKNARGWFQFDVEADESEDLSVGIVVAVSVAVVAFCVVVVVFVACCIASGPAILVHRSVFLTETIACTT